jgi:hypothetical protein
VRIYTAAIVTVGLVVSLSACASSSAPSGACTPTAESGAASELVTATGETGTEISVDFPTPLIADGVEVSTITPGDGAVVYPGQPADFHVSIYSGTTGELIPVQGLEATTILTANAGETRYPFGAAIECATVGSRIASTSTVATLFGDSVTTMEPTDTVVIVTDIVTSYLGRADGVDQLAVNGMPALALAPDGQPGITVPNEEAPTKSRAATTKLGDGDTIEEDDLVVVNYTALEWGSDATFANTWEEGRSDLFLASSDDTGTTGGVVPGLAEALIGSTVGSQFIAVVAPEDGYAEDATPPTGVTAGSTLVYVVDVLGVQGEGEDDD